MNNGKVRIYELSKELNLDNKDILDICDQLNIAVKSHSSTITESQAEHIRATAEKYTPERVASKSHGSASAEVSGNAPRSRTPGQAKGERKQQILAIHHKQNRPNFTPDSQASAKSSSMFASPPRPPVKLQSPATPIAPQVNRPVAQSSSESSSKTVSPPETPKSQSRALQLQIATAEEFVAQEAKEESPQLLQPPSRTDQHSPRPKADNKTVVRLAQKPESPTNVSEPALNVTKQKKSGKTVLDSVSRKPREESLASIELLQKPQKPQAAAETSPDLVAIADSSELETLPAEGLEGDGLLANKQKPKLKRPTPPGKVKRPAWEEEEEEGQEALGKASKAGTKGKRRAQLVIDEDEEDLESELENVSLPTSVSLSVARPPKPKSETKPLAATTSSSKLKKATPKTEGSTTRTKSERRDRKETVERPDTIVFSGSLTVRELSDLLKVPETEIIKALFFKGIAVNITQTLDADTARLIAEELGVKVESAEKTAAATKTTEILDAKDLEYLQRRPPVVTIMGHVDHGKTTLLDSIRQTKVAQGEAGGITQHIGAYHVDVEHEGQKEQIVFLDTPGHEAFTAMRARGARVTDIAILVVAADDGVQPQTREAVSHAKAAGVPIVVAINKVDKIDANPDRIKQELSELELVPEEWGGDTIMVPVSALKGENLDSLLEMILLVAELEELSANPDRPARGTVIEAHLDRTRGPVATLLVQNGTLRVGDIIVAGSVFGKIRAMIDDRTNKVEAATPSFAVEVLGLNDVPEAGDEFDVFDGERDARLVATERADNKRNSRLQQAMSSRRVTLSSLSAQAQEGELKELNLILKADVQGSVEAILGALQQLPQNEVQIRVLLAAPGEATETDVDLAAASGAVIVGFNTTLASGARQAADQEGVDIREYNIIYKLLDDIQGAMEGLLDPEEVEEPLGQAEVRAVFPVGRGAVAGCYVLSGKLVRNRSLRVRRNGEVIYQGIMDSLKRMKEDAREVNAGYECGVGVSKFNDWKEGDIIEAYEMVMKRRTLSAN